MKEIKLLLDNRELQVEFKRCCENYDEIEMYTAWVGSPRRLEPFTYLKNLQHVKIFLGIDFHQSDPRGIVQLMAHNYDVQIVEDKCTYHPKLYFFFSGTNIALIMGSSNFTYAGFFDNFEGNVLIEGDESDQSIQKFLNKVRLRVKKCHTFTPDDEWLAEYEFQYDQRQKATKKLKFKEETQVENKLTINPTWLAHATWKEYLQYIQEGIKSSALRIGEDLSVKLALFDEYAEYLKLPWTPRLFNQLENRRRILGKKKYASLGHVGASGRIQQLLATSTLDEQNLICQSINTLASLKTPLNYDHLQEKLNKLSKLGPSIKVWGRLLAITRPDLYLTISSKSVRESVSTLTNKPKSFFEKIDGYIELLKLIHQSPWYNSPCPEDDNEKEIWLRRVAFLDVVFY